MAKLKVSLSIGFVGAVHEEVLEIDDEEVAQCETAEEIENLCQDYWKDWSGNYIDGGFELIK